MTVPNNDTASQRARALAWLLFIMSIAARIFELKARGFDIVTHKTQAGSAKIARYILLSSRHPVTRFEAGGGHD